jgi:hypothetical protein
MALVDEKGLDIDNLSFSFKFLDFDRDSKGGGETMIPLMSYETSMYYESSCPGGVLNFSKRYLGVKDIPLMERIFHRHYEDCEFFHTDYDTFETKPHYAVECMCEWLDTEVRTNPIKMCYIGTTTKWCDRCGSCSNGCSRSLACGNFNQDMLEDHRDHEVIWYNPAKFQNVDPSTLYCLLDDEYGNEDPDWVVFREETDLWDK